MQYIINANSKHAILHHTRNLW